MPRMRCSTSSRSKVESTAWPASYRTAILFIVHADRNVSGKLGQVPKVTSTVAIVAERVRVSRVVPSAPRAPRVCRQNSHCKRPRDPSLRSGSHLGYGEPDSTLLPSSRRANQPVSHHTKPEVHHQPPIRLKRLVARQVKPRRKKEVCQVAQDNGAESLNQIDQHRGFRHRLCAVGFGHEAGGGLSRSHCIYLMNRLFAVWPRKRGGGLTAAPGA